MEAVRTIGCESFDVSTVLVLGGSLSDQNKEIASVLGVDFREDFRWNRSAENGKWGYIGGSIE